MRPRWLTVLTGLLFFATAFEYVHAQSVTVQQPVVSQFGVATTVSVPDRGTGFVGGVRRAADSSQRSFRFLPNSNIGRERSQRSLTTSVSIHDFAEMDRQLLSSEATPATLYSIPSHRFLDNRTPRSADANPAERKLRSYTRIESTNSTPGLNLESASHSEKMIRHYLDLSQRATQQGNRRLAEYYARQAASYK